MKLSKKQTVWKKPVIIAATVVLLGAVGYILYAKQQSLWPFTPSINTLTNDNYQKINYSSPTEQEKRDSQNAKKNNTNPEQNTDENSDSDSSKKTVSVMVNAGITGNNLEIRASTPSIIEASGTCTATVSNGVVTLPTKSSDAFMDASSSICRPIYIATSSLNKGKWYVSVAYSSPSAQGISDKQVVTVQ